MPLKEECGVFGIFSNETAAQITYLGLYALQHRGQESAGIITYNRNQNEFHQHKKNGLVSQVFSKKDLNYLKGNSAIGHVRYSTTGEDNLVNIQPLLINCIKGSIALAHNGNLTNARELYNELRSGGAIFQTTLDTEVIIHLVARSEKKKTVDAIQDVLGRIQGAYSLVFLTKDSLIAARDPFGVRPLVLGELGDQYVIASETCALDLVGARYIRDVEPGEMIVISKYGMKSLRFAEKQKQKNLCIFEYIYFSRPDSFLFGQNVHEIQKNLGRQLAREAPAEADIVISVPDSGNSATMGFSLESGIPYEMGLMRNHYVGRTFIQNSQLARESGVKIKLSPIRSVLKDKRVLVIDDSLVRGTTSRKIVRMIRSAGASEVHLRISSPPYKYPCFYGVDTPSSEQLIASNHSIEEIRNYLDVNSLAYLSREGLISVVTQNQNKNKPDDFCTACFNGDYRIPLFSSFDHGKEALEKK